MLNTNIASSWIIGKIQLWGWFFRLIVRFLLGSVLWKHEMHCNKVVSFSRGLWSTKSQSFALECSCYSPVKPFVGCLLQIFVLDTTGNVLFSSICESQMLPILLFNVPFCFWEIRIQSISGFMRESRVFQQMNSTLEKNSISLFQWISSKLFPKL